MYSDHVLILTNFSYKDALTQTYTLPYVRMIRKRLNPNKKIFFRTLEQKKYSIDKNEQQRVRKELQGEGLTWHESIYFSFGWKALFYNVWDLITLLALCYRQRIKIIHVWCTTPAVQAYFLSVLTGAEIIIDSYEPHAEAMVENGQWKRGSMSFRILFLFEGLISRKAKYIISATQGMRDYALKKYRASFSHFFVKPACVDLNLFSFQQKKNPELLERLNLKDKIVGLYAGKFGTIYHDQEIFDFIKVLSDYYGDRFRMLILTIHEREEIEAWCRKANLDPAIVLSVFVPHKDIAVYMGLADFAITPVKSVPSKRYCTPIKDGEYWAMGLPVIITPNISDDSDIISQNEIGAILQGFTKDDYDRTVAKLDYLLTHNSPRELYDKIHYIASRYRSMQIAEDVYKQVYY